MKKEDVMVMNKIGQVQTDQVIFVRRIIPDAMPVRMYPNLAVSVHCNERIHFAPQSMRHERVADSTRFSNINIRE